MPLKRESIFYLQTYQGFAIILTHQNQDRLFQGFEGPLRNMTHLYFKANPPRISILMKTEKLVRKEDGKWQHGKMLGKNYI